MIHFPISMEKMGRRTESLLHMMLQPSRTTAVQRNFMTKRLERSAGSSLPIKQIW